MLRSCSYAAHAAARASGADPDHELAARWVSEVEEALGAAFSGPYLAAMADTGLLPEQPERVERLLRAFQVAKAFYELAYELNNRPDWVAIPIRGIERLLGAEAGSGGTTR
jgi:maltose alpha-D-glucosyltransferase / alpha-amylase